MFAPIILTIIWHFDYYDNKVLSSLPLPDFLGAYLANGFMCIFDLGFMDDISPGLCSFSFFPMLFYVIAVFGIQGCISSLMQMKMTRTARGVLAFMVFLTSVSFAAAHESMPEFIVAPIETILWGDFFAL